MRAPKRCVSRRATASRARPASDASTVARMSLTVMVPPLLTSSPRSDRQLLEQAVRDVADDQHDEPPEAGKIHRLAALEGGAAAGPGAVLRRGHQELPRLAPGHRRV